MTAAAGMASSGGYWYRKSAIPDMVVKPPQKPAAQNDLLDSVLNLELKLIKPRNIAPKTFTIRSDSEPAMLEPRLSSSVPPIRYLSSAPSEPPRKTREKSRLVIARVQDVIWSCIFFSSHLDDGVLTTLVSAHRTSSS